MKSWCLGGDRWDIDPEWVGGNETQQRGPWVAQSVTHATLGFSLGSGSQDHGNGRTSGSAVGMESAWDSILNREDYGLKLKREAQGIVRGIA